MGFVFADTPEKKKKKKTNTRFLKKELRTLKDFRAWSPQETEIKLRLLVWHTLPMGHPHSFQ